LAQGGGLLPASFRPGGGGAAGSGTSGGQGGPDPVRRGGLDPAPCARGGGALRWLGYPRRARGGVGDDEPFGPP
ncbi:hypothetical protein ABTC63_21470, partial [Acinetobacter baumannii]